MAALNIAFEAPDNAGGACPSKGRPIDLVHLANQTMGDKALELEVLQVFARQARELIKDIAVSDAAGREAAAHRLKGAARAIGANAVARTAETLENDCMSPAAIAAVGAAVVDAENFILKLCR